MQKTPFTERLDNWIWHSAANYLLVHPDDFLEVLEHPKRNPQFVQNEWGIFYKGLPLVPLGAFIPFPMKTNLIPAQWEPMHNSKAALFEAAQGGMEFTIADMSNSWNGATTTIQELVEAGYTSAQIRYGKNNTKVWFGNLWEIL